MPELKKYFEDQIAAWTERSEIAQRDGYSDLAAAALELASHYRALLESEDDHSTESEMLSKANLIRKRIESSEQHRTMCVEHGLSDAAIDATYEIQEMQKELVSLVFG